MTTPAAIRVAGAQKDGYVATGGVTALRRMFLPAAAASEFRKWSEDRVTVLVRDALRDMVLNGPTHVASQDAAVQYGVTSGLALALQIITDPSLVYPELFTGVVARQVAAPVPDYGTSIGDMLDAAPTRKE